MTVKLLTEHHLEFLSKKKKKGCTGSSKSTLVKMPHCWKSHVAAHFFILKERRLTRTCLLPMTCIIFPTHKQTGDKPSVLFMEHRRIVQTKVSE